MTNWADPDERRAYMREYARAHYVPRERKRMSDEERIRRRRARQAEYKQRPEVKARRAEAEMARRRRNGIGPREVGNPDDIRLTRNERRRARGKTDRERAYMESYRQMPRVRAKHRDYDNAAAAAAWKAPRVAATADGESARARYTPEDDAAILAADTALAAAFALGRPLSGIYQRRARLRAMGALR